MARVNDETYNLFDVDLPESKPLKCAIVSGKCAATRTKFMVDTGERPVLFGISLTCQSKGLLATLLTIGCLTVSVIGILDGKLASVQIYSDIDV